MSSDPDINWRTTAGMLRTLANEVDAGQAPDFVIVVNREKWTPAWHIHGEQDLVALMGALGVVQGRMTEMLLENITGEYFVKEP